jgi:hypothetical protein
LNDCSKSQIQVLLLEFREIQLKVQAGDGIGGGGKTARTGAGYPTLATRRKYRVSSAAQAIFTLLKTLHIPRR